MRSTASLDGISGVKVWNWLGRKSVPPVSTMSAGGWRGNGDVAQQPRRGRPRALMSSAVRGRRGCGDDAAFTRVTSSSRFMQVVLTTTQRCPFDRIVGAAGPVSATANAAMLRPISASGSGSVPGIDPTAPPHRRPASSYSTSSTAFITAASRPISSGR